jgi:WD40 repeat protein
MIARLAFSPDSRHLATGSVGNEIHVWDIATGKILFERQGECAASVAFSPDGWVLGTAGSTGGYRWRWESESNGKPLGAASDHGRRLKIAAAKKSIT